MKKAIFVNALLMTLMLTIPTRVQPATESTWVMMHGRVERYGTDFAWGHCGVMAEVGKWAEVCAAWVLSKPCITVIFNFYAARLTNTTLVELNYSGADLYISGLWNVYNVTFIYEPHVPGTPENYTLTIELLVDHGEGTMVVTGNWAAFTIAIRGTDEVVGTVKRWSIRPREPIPIGDVCGPAGDAEDGRINIWDLVHTAKAYGSTPGMPGMCYDFSMDFNFDFKIDIYDLTTVAANLGKEY